MRARGRGQRGQALTELALCSVVLILLMFGALDLTRVFNAQTNLQSAAREGARLAIQFDGSGNSNPNQGSGADTSIQNVVNTVLHGAGLPSTSTIVEPACYGTAPPSNGPIPDASLPTATNDPWLYICYDASSGGGVPGTNCSPTCGGYDTEIRVAMRYGLIMTGIIGPNVTLQATSHMRVQGS